MDQLDASVRNALDTSRPPMDRERMKAAFLDQAKSVRNSNRRISFRVVAIAACFILAIAMHILYLDTQCPIVESTASQSILQRVHASLHHALTAKKDAQFELIDGTNLTCREDAIFSIQYQPNQRIIHLYQGSIFFDVASNPARPFTVVCGESETTAIGTQFTVSAIQDSMENES
ncbi:FecR domain-containing protein [bacterium]|nr:FecR domain-containing protein [bacterium]